MHDYRQQESGNSQAGNVSFRPVADNGLVWLQLASGNRSDPIRVPFDVSEALDFRFGFSPSRMASIIRSIAHPSS